MTEINSMHGLGTGTIVWWALSNLAALFIGGMVAGRMSGLPSNSDGGLHGFLAWGLYLILFIYLVTSSIGSVFNGMASAANSVFSDSTSTNVVQALEDAKKKGTEDATLSLEGIKKEALQLIRTAEKKNILPNDASEETQKALNKTQRESQAFLNHLNLDENIDEFFNDISVDLDNEGNLSITADGYDNVINKEEIKNYLVENTELSEAEINSVIEKWDRKINKAIDKAEKFYEKARDKAAEVTEETTDAIGKYSIIAFFLFLLGAGAAFAGGAIGSPFLTVEEEQREEKREEYLEK